MAALSQHARSSYEVLDWGRAFVDPALRRAVDRLAPSTRHVAGYQIGWWDAGGEPTEGAGGKALRPTLCLLTASAIGADPVAALPAAVAIELAHNHSLLHDDVIDRDHLRRHRRTAWSVFGVGPAILAGDALLAAALHELAAGADEHAESSLQALCCTVLTLVAGQSLDLEFEQRADVDVGECARMAEAKTGALLGCACALGAMFGGGAAAQVQQLRLFGERLGLAFQLVDDLLGIWGDPAVTGKPVHSDLCSRKKTVPVVAALRSHTAAGTELAVLYRGSEPLSEHELARAADLIERSGARRWVESQADEQLALALGHLRRADLAGPAVHELTALAHLVTTRDR